jgi:hypothetical protein
MNLLPRSFRVATVVLSLTATGAFAMGKAPDPNDPATNNRDVTNQTPGVTNTNPNNSGNPAASPFPNQGGLPNNPTGTGSTNNPNYNPPAGTRAAPGTTETGGSSGSGSTGSGGAGGR